jgi:YD repeat-containing protein
MHEVAESAWNGGALDISIPGWTWSGTTDQLSAACQQAITTANATYPDWHLQFQGVDGPSANSVGTRQAYCQGHFPSGMGRMLAQFVESCPATFTPGLVSGPTHNHCHRFVRLVDKYFDRPKEKSCPKTNPGTGDPIFPLTGVNRQEIDLGLRVGGQSLTLSYDTRSKVPGAASTSHWQVPALAAFGPLWQSSLHKSMVLQADGAAVGSAYSNVLMNRGANVFESASVAGFDSCSGGGGGGGGSYSSKVEPNHQISYSGSAGRLVDGRDLSEEDYDASGAVLNVAQARGQQLSYSYSTTSTPASTAPSPGLLLQISDSFGRSIQFSYEAGGLGGMPPRITSITGPDAQVIHAAYDAGGNLASLTWPDNQVRSFLYERGDLPWALTGIIDENNKRHTTYAYDSEGRATSTELANGADRYALQYAAGGAPSWSVTETVSGNLICREHRWVAPSGAKVIGPSGQTNELSATTQQGMVALTAQSQPAGSGCAASSSSQDYDGNGNVTVLDDKNGNRSCFAYDSTRNLRTITLSGLSNSTTCPANLSSYVPAGTDPAHPQRIVSTQWHPDWVLQSKQAEPGKITTSIYNGQPDPFNGGAVASCAPSTALLPDGKPIAVLCKQVEQATTDTDGHLGFSAGLQSGVANRTSSWTYNQYGQVLTEDGPRTDVNDVTTYTYYSDTTADHTMGDLQSVTNAAGKVTSYSKYNRHGQVLESTDANGVTTINTYDLRQRLLSSTVGGQTTSYGYDAAGQLKKVTLPDSSWVGYDYDDAHRQVAVYDNKGSRTEYQLDNAGNRTGETTKDPSGNLKRQLSRSIDALGRVQQTTGRE